MLVTFKNAELVIVRRYLIYIFSFAYFCATAYQTNENKKIIQIGLRVKT